MTMQSEAASENLDLWNDYSSLILAGIALASIFVLWCWRKTKYTNDDGFESHSANGRIIHFRDLPSPRGFPVLGNAAQLGTKPYLKLTEWAGTLGPLYRVRLGGTDMLVINGLDLLRKATAKGSTEFAGRPVQETTKLIAAKQSVIFKDYSEQWMKNKKCAIDALKLYTTGREPTERSGMEECASRHANNLADQLIRQASQQEDNIVDPEAWCLKISINAISEVCFGHAFELDDPTFAMFVNMSKNFDRAMGEAQLVNFWPFLKHVPVLGRGYKNLKKVWIEYENFTHALLKDHWRTYNPDTMRDLVDCLRYQSELVSSGERSQNAEDANKPNAPRPSQDAAVNVGSRATTMGEHRQQRGASNLDKNTNYAAADLYGAGLDAVHAVITWAFFYLAAYPETQTKVRDELSRVVAPDEEPSLRRHGKRCPYTQAWLYEVMRHVAIVPMSVPHQTTKDTVLANCFVPKGVMVMFNFWETTRDPKIWENPEEFQPQRFLRTNPQTGEHELRGDVTNRVTVWGLGLRQCPGAQLSRHQLFIFISTVVKRCLVSQSRPGFEPAHPWKTDLGLSIKATPFKVKITPLREKS